MRSTLPLEWKVWHRVRNMMYRVVEISSGLVTIVEKIGDNPHKAHEILWPGDSKNLTVMQATPYKDTNLKRIFDLDLVRTLDGPRKAQTGTVIFQDGLFMVRYDTVDAEGETLVPLLVSCDSEIQVMGSSVKEYTDARQPE